MMHSRLSHLPATPATDANNNTLYQTVTIIDTTTVQFYEQFGLGYHSWNGLADIGGLAFALYIMKTVRASVCVCMWLEPREYQWSRLICPLDRDDIRWLLPGE